MTNEIEKQFFDTFGIVARACIESCDKCQHYSYDYGLSGYCTLDSDYDNCGVAIKQYPQITDHILLELICILAKQGIYLEDIDGLFKMKTYETRIVMQNADNLKDVILKTAKTACRLSKDDNFKHQVRTLFEEE